MNNHNLLAIKILTALLLLFGSQMAQSQDLFSLENSLKFADHLFADHKFTEAAAEYERVLFMEPGNQYALQRQILAYGNADQYAVCIGKFGATNTDSLSGHLAFLYGKSLIKTGRLAQAQTYANGQNNMARHDKTLLLCTALAFNKQFTEAISLLNSSEIGTHAELNQYRASLAGAVSVKQKSPALSMAMSAIVPGSGKIYSGYWKDGLVVLAFTGVSAWQSYRGFSKTGVTSIYGWVYAGSSMGFYLGNIYGARKAAFKFNTTQVHKTIHRIESIFDNH